MAQVPLLKIGVLFVKTLAKPVAKRLQKAAADHPTFQKVCVTVGNTMNRISLGAEISLMGLKTREIKPLHESVAIARGAELLGEAFVFLVGAVLLWFEVSRQQYQKDEETRKKEVQAEVKETMRRRRLEAIEERLNAMSDRLGAMERALGVSRQEIVAAVGDDEAHAATLAAQKEALVAAEAKALRGGAWTSRAWRWVFGTPETPLPMAAPPRPKHPVAIPQQQPQQQQQQQQPRPQTPPQVAASVSNGEDDKEEEDEELDVEIDDDDDDEDEDDDDDGGGDGGRGGDQGGDGGDAQTSGDHDVGDKGSDSDSAPLDPDADDGASDDSDGDVAGDSDADSDGDADVDVAIDADPDE